MIFVGLVLGKWWRVLVPVAAIGWAAVLIATGVGSGTSFALGAAFFGLINVTLGVLVFQGVRHLAHRVGGKTS